jgi:hypothetical protein
MISKTEFSINESLITEALTSIPSEDFKFTLNRPTGNFFYDPWEVKDEFKNSIWEKILSSIKDSIGEARIINLKPGACYFSHADIDDRWHLSLIGNRSYLIDLDNQIMNKLKADGNWYSMNAGLRHTAANFGQIDRYQLVVRKLLIRNFLENPVTVEIIEDEDRYDYRYIFDNEISPWLNQANKLKKISNFSYHQKSVRFDVDEKFMDELLSISKNFRIIETDLMMCSRKN